MLLRRPQPVPLLNEIHEEPVGERRQRPAHPHTIGCWLGHALLLSTD